MVDFNVLYKIKLKMSSEEKEVEALLNEVWMHFRDVLKGKHEEETIYTSMDDQITVINGYLKNAEDSINKGDHGSASRWLESAEKSNRVIEEFDGILEKLEREELKNVLKMKKNLWGLRGKIGELRRKVEEAQRAKTKAA